MILLWFIDRLDSSQGGNPPKVNWSKVKLCIQKGEHQKAFVKHFRYVFLRYAVF